MKKTVDGLSLSIPKDVYDPAEDSFLLAENIVLESKQKVLEVGCGSGYVSLYLAQKYPLAEFFCLDINFIAAKTTHQNALENILPLQVFSADLFSPLKISQNNPFFDVILFNSPYLPYTEVGELEKAWAGGKDGLEIVQLFVEVLAKYLNKTGSAYLVVSSKTNLAKLELLLAKQKFSFEIIDQVCEGSERILLYRIVK